MGVSAAQGDGLAAGAPRLLGPGTVRVLASEGTRPRGGRGEGVAGTMEGVLYKWTNYLSGEWGRARGRVLCLSGPRAALGLASWGSWSWPLLVPEGPVRTGNISPKQFFQRTVYPQAVRAHSHVGLGEGRSSPFTSRKATKS